MLTLGKVAVTGGLSCGKSSACRLFKELGAYTVSADEIVHQLLSPKTLLGQQVISLLGRDIITDNQIDRSKIAKKVFSSQKLLQSLQELLHPAVLHEIERQYQEAKKKRDVLLFVAEVPLLFEIAAEDYFDYIVAIEAELETCKKRFKATTGYEDEEYNRRMAHQMPPDEKSRQADYVIENNGDLNQLYKAVAYVFDKLISSSNT